VLDWTGPSSTGLSPSSVPSRRPFAVAALVALCLLLSGLAPSVSRVLAQARADAHDLCVADASSAGRVDAPVGHHGSGDEPACALCAAHGGSHAAPPSQAAGSMVAAGADEPAVRALAERRIGRVALAAPPRGPPPAVG
jgi:hypothetical protein